MDICAVIGTLLDGGVVTRASWDNKVLFQAGGYTIPAEDARLNGPMTKELLYACGEPNFNVAPHIDLFDGKEYHTGYVFTQEDLFADDWYIVEDILKHFTGANNEQTTSSSM